MISKNHFNNLANNNNISNYYPQTNNQLQNTNSKTNNQSFKKPFHSNVNFNFANIQTKLKVSQPGDVYEQEADRIAEEVMRMSSILDPIITSNTLQNHERIDRRKCSACEMKEKEEEEKKNLDISRKSSTIFNLETTTDEITNDISIIRSSEATSLDANTREFMESRFGFDFSKVRIHTDETAAKSAYSVNSLAYTVGNDIVFGEGQYNPNSLDGRKLLAHELTHVVQQKGNVLGLLRVPRLTAVPAGAPSFPPEFCGDIDFPIYWELSEKSDVKKGGFVIQHIKERWETKKCDGKPVENLRPLMPTSHSPVEFFEAWRVLPGSTDFDDTDTDTDHFRWTSAHPWGGGQTFGSLTIEGTARYHDGVPEIDMPTHMVRKNDKTFATELLSSTIDPKLDGNISQPIRHYLGIHWKCCPSPDITVVDDHVP
jgi:hypothetical protein